eukprot:s2538_g23.t1
MSIGPIGWLPCSQVTHQISDRIEPGPESKVLDVQRPLRQHWNKQRFTESSVVQRLIDPGADDGTETVAEDGEGASVSVDLVDATIRDTLFWARVSVVADISAEATVSSSWAEG